MVAMHSHMTTHLVTAIRVEAEHATPRPRIARSRRPRAALRRPRRRVAACRLILPA